MPRSSGVAGSTGIAPGDLTRDTTLYTMGYSHLDTQWRWDYETTIRKYILSTMVDNFRLLDKYPGYTFNFTGANRYIMMKEYYPAEYARVKAYVAAGRWFPAGSSLEEADALVPSPESLIRNILYGNRFFRQEFGKASNEYMVPDCFGFPASMPSIFTHAGLKGFSTQKLTWGSAVGVPFNFGLWEGTDGSTVIASLNPGEYVGTVKENLSTSPTWRARLRENGVKSGVVADYMYFGTGDIGGAPGEETVQWVDKSIAGPGPVRVLSAPASRFFDDVGANGEDPPAALQGRVPPDEPLRGFADVAVIYEALEPEERTAGIGGGGIIGGSRLAGWCAVSRRAVPRGVAARDRCAVPRRARGDVHAARLRILLER